MFIGYNLKYYDLLSFVHISPSLLKFKELKLVSMYHNLEIVIDLMRNLEPKTEECNKF